MPTIIANQNDELAKVKNKIRALAAKTVDNGCTEYEALAAMKKVGELLEVYNLELDDALLETERCVKGVFKTKLGRRTKINLAVRGIARFTDCHTYLSNGEGYLFYGFESDVSMAIYLCGLIGEAIETELAHYKRTDPQYLEGRDWPPRKTLSTNFYKGMAERIGERLIEMKDAMDRRDKDKHQDDVRKHVVATSTLPMCVMKKKKVKSNYDAWLEENHIRLRTVRSNSRFNGSARAAGARAGNRVNLNRPLNGRGQRLLG